MDCSPERLLGIVWPRYLGLNFIFKIHLREKYLHKNNCAQNEDKAKLKWNRCGTGATHIKVLGIVK